MDQEKIGRFIAKLRKEKNMTQESLADKLGISSKSISRWENGRCMPDLSLFEPLSSELSVSVNDLMSGEIIDKKEYQEVFEKNIFKTIAKVDKRNKKLIITIFSVSILILLLFCFSVEKIIYTKKINENLISPNNAVRNVTSQQVKNIKKGMTYKEIITKLGATKQDGFGVFSVAYLVDNKDLLYISFDNINNICDKSGEELYELMIKTTLIDKAYDYLDKETKSKIINLYQATVTTLNIKNTAYFYLDRNLKISEIKNKEIIIIDFEKYNSINITVILDSDTREVLGLGLAD